jgi:hypothetical protein
MGGEREIEISKSLKSVGGVSFGTLRCHEKSGEIHFHDDANKRKVAVPTGVWFKLYERLTAEAPNRVQYADSTNQSLLSIKSKIRKGKSGGMTLDLSAKIKPLEVAPDFAALQKFTQG